MLGNMRIDNVGACGQSIIYCKQYADFTSSCRPADLSWVLDSLGIQS